MEIAGLTVEEMPMPSTRSNTKSAQTTTNHDTIRTWVEARGGCPASVKSTRTKNDPGVLRIDFHSVIGEHTLECVPWDEWFRGFEDNDLAFLYEDEKDSRFNKLIARDNSR
jgi:hypothetical protein